MRREEGAAAWKEKMGHDVTACRNNEDMYDKKLVDAVFISTADFQHALRTLRRVPPRALRMSDKSQSPDWLLPLPSSSNAANLLQPLFVIFITNSPLTILSLLHKLHRFRFAISGDVYIVSAGQQIV